MPAFAELTKLSLYDIKFSPLLSMARAAIQGLPVFSVTVRAPSKGRGHAAPRCLPVRFSCAVLLCCPPNLLSPAVHLCCPPNLLSPAVLLCCPAALLSCLILPLPHEQTAQLFAVNSRAVRCTTVSRHHRYCPPPNAVQLGFFAKKTKLRIVAKNASSFEPVCTVTASSAKSLSLYTPCPGCLCSGTNSRIEINRIDDIFHSWFSSVYSVPIERPRRGP